MELQTEQNLIFSLNSDILKGFLKPLKELTNEITLNINQYGLKVFEIDSANVSLIEVELNKNQFDSFNFIENKSICLNVDSLYNTIKDLKKTLVYFYLNKDILTLKYNGFKTDLSLIERENNRTEHNLNDYNCKIQLDSKRFKEIITQFKKLKEDSLMIEFKNNELYFKGFKTKTELLLNNIDDYKVLNFIKDSYSKYSIEYLNKFIKTDISQNVIINFSNDYPLKLEYNNNDFKIKFILAPRIIEED